MSLISSTEGRIMNVNELEDDDYDNVWQSSYDGKNHRVVEGAEP